MRFPIIILFLLGFNFVSPSQTFKQVSFNAADQMQITADEYLVDKNAPYIILFHQARSSRGEFREIAPRFNKLGYNCLAVDLRSGNEGAGVTNETAMKAQNFGKSAEYLDALQDVIAAIGYAQAKSRKNVILLGSSFSASLALIAGKDDPRVKAVMAFSPGEYFDIQLNVQKNITGFAKPVFAACAADEEPYVRTLMSGVISAKKIIFAPSLGGKHGAKSLISANKNHNDYWLNIINFLKNIKD
ncbi:MAG: dienelactone hydrolase family protein [Bacteroidia bacterium]|nr:dienelactone hydrolase family protein [Bacteroidia bacterium]